MVEMTTQNQHEFKHRCLAESVKTAISPAAQFTLEMDRGTLNAALQQMKYFICMSTQREWHRVNAPRKGFLRWGDEERTKRTWQKWQRSVCLATMK